MNKEQQSLYPSLHRVMLMSGRLNPAGLRDDFPNTIWNHGGVETMSACVGFIRGIVAAGMPLEKGESFAKTLFRSFHLGMQDNRYEEDESLSKWDRPHLTKLVVTGSSTFLCFGFSQHFLAKVQDKDLEVPESTMFIGNAYQDSTRERKWRYVRGMWGGIDFHGLEETFSVCLTPTLGWQMHT